MSARRLVVPDYLDLLARLLVGGTFAYAALDKIAHPAAFAVAVSHYRLLPPAWLHVFALVLPWLELVTGLALLLGKARRGAALLITGMLVMFMGAIGWALAHDLDISCGCFNTGEGHVVGVSLLLRDLFLLAGAVLTLAVGGVRRSFGAPAGGPAPPSS